MEVPYQQPHFLRFKNWPLILLRPSAVLAEADGRPRGIGVLAEADTVVSCTRFRDCPDSEKVLKAAAVGKFIVSPRPAGSSSSKSAVLRNPAGETCAGADPKQTWGGWARAPPGRGASTLDSAIRASFGLGPNPQRAPLSFQNRRPSERSRGVCRVLAGTCAGVRSADSNPSASSLKLAFGPPQECSAKTLSNVLNVRKQEICTVRAASAP